MNHIVKVHRFIFNFLIFLLICVLLNVCADRSSSEIKELNSMRFGILYPYICQISHPSYICKLVDNRDFIKKIFHTYI